MKFDVAGIYVINLAHRTERWSLFLDDLHYWEAAFDKTPQQFPATNGIDLPGYGQKPWFGIRRISENRKRSWGGKAGCILSHQSVIQKAAEQNWANVLIVEDDAIMTPEMAQLWKHGINQLLARLPDDWSMINFCTTIPITPCRVVEEFNGVKLVESGGAFGAVAYLLNGKILHRMLEELPKEGSIWSWVARHKTIDRWYSQNLLRFGRVYLFAPAIVGHRTGSSDISMTQENDYLLDFSLQDIRYVQNNGMFLMFRTFRRVDNVFRRYFSFFRFFIKRLRGL